MGLQFNLRQSIPIFHWFFQSFFHFNFFTERNFFNHFTIKNGYLFILLSILMSTGLLMGLLGDRTAYYNYIFCG